MLKNTAIQYIIGFGFTILLIPIIEATIHFFPNISWKHASVILIFTALIFQILFYYLTTHYNFGWTALSFIINVILWTVEQVVIEKNFHDELLHHSNELLILGGLLWVTNKILIDKIFELNKSTTKGQSKIALAITRALHYCRNRVYGLF
jgi:hypothetical protein